MLLQTIKRQECVQILLLNEKVKISKMRGHFLGNDAASNSKKARFCENFLV
jgi:hypothetical protein